MKPADSALIWPRWTSSAAVITAFPPTTPTANSADSVALATGTIWPDLSPTKPFTNTCKSIPPLTIWICGQLVSPKGLCPAAWSAPFSAASWEKRSRIFDLAIAFGSRMPDSPAPSLKVKIQSKKCKFVLLQQLIKQSNFAPLTQTKWTKSARSNCPASFATTVTTSKLFKFTSWSFRTPKCKSKTPQKCQIA